MRRVAVGCWPEFEAVEFEAAPRELGVCVCRLVAIDWPGRVESCTQREEEEEEERRQIGRWPAASCQRPVCWAQRLITTNVARLICIVSVRSLATIDFRATGRPVRRRRRRRLRRAHLSLGSIEWSLFARRAAGKWSARRSFVRLFVCRQLSPSSSRTKDDADEPFALGELRRETQASQSCTSLCDGGRRRSSVTPRRPFAWEFGAIFAARRKSRVPSI